MLEDRVQRLDRRLQFVTKVSDEKNRLVSTETAVVEQLGERWVCQRAQFIQTGRWRGCIDHGVVDRGKVIGTGRLKQAWVKYME